LGKKNDPCAMAIVREALNHHDEVVRIAASIEIKKQEFRQALKTDSL
jgi:hypothetical protein